MKKEELNELRKIFEKNSKKASENKEKEKTKDNEKGEKEKSGSVYEKNKFNDNIINKNNVNKSVYINSSNIDKMKNIFNNQNKNKEKGNELEIIRKSLAPVKEKKENKKEEKKIELRKSEKIEFKKAESSELQKNNLKDMPNIFSNVESKIKRAETNQNKKVIKPQDHYKNEQNIPIGNEINNENKKIKENNNVNFKDKISMFNNFIEKNKKNETGTQDFYSRVKTHYIKDTIKNITTTNFEKNNNEVNEYKQTFDTLHNLQAALKKESSFRELCKNIIIIFILYIYSYKNKRRNKEKNRIRMY